MTSGERSKLHQPPVQTDAAVKAAGDAQTNHGGGPPAAEAQAESKPKRRGRKKASYETVQKEAKIADDWRQARESGILKAEFARGSGMTLKQLDALLNRVAKRKSRSDK